MNSYTTNKRIIELDHTHPAWKHGYRYNIQITTSIDGGKKFWYCGLGKFCKTKEEVKAYEQHYITGRQRQ